MATAQDLIFLGPGPTNQPLGTRSDFPSVQFFPNQVLENQGIYFEDREVNGEQWMVQNATYNQASGQWLPVDPTRACRAFVSSGTSAMCVFRQSPAGVSPCVFSNKWSITDTGVASMSLQIASLPANVDMSAIGIYNVLAPKYGMVAGINTPSQAAANATALQAACNDAINNGGAVYIPSATAPYYTNPGITITAKNRNFGIFGTTDRAQLFVPASSGGGTLFNMTGLAGSPAQAFFENLEIQYDTPLTGNAIYLQATQTVRIANMIFVECPTAVNNNHALQTVVDNCVFITNVQQNCQTVVLSDIGGPEAGTQDFTMQNCLLRQTGVLNNVGLYVGQANVFKITNVLFANYDKYCIQIAGGPLSAQFGYFSNVIAIGNGTACFIQPSVNTYNIQEIKFSSCLFRHQHWKGGPFDTLPGIYVDTNGGSNQIVTGLTFDNVTIDTFGGSGLYLNAGIHIKVNAGRISGNNLSKTGLQGNLSIIGAQDVEVDGASLIGNCGFEPGTAPYALFLGSNCFNIFVDHTNLRGCTQGAVSGTGSANIQITNSPGYNDQGTVVATSFTPSLGTNFTASQLGTTPYYGPVEIYLTNGTGSITGILSNGQTTGLTSGTFRLNPGNQDQLKVNGSGTIGCIAIGK